MVLNDSNITHHIGIIGGMGPFAGQRFVRHVLEYARDAYGARRDEEYPQMSIESIALPAFTAHGIDDTSKYIPLLTEILTRLESNGAQAITIPCNTIHTVHAELQKSVHVPLLNIVEETVARVISHTTRRAYILATGSTISDGLYHTALSAHGVVALQPTLENQQRVEDLITALEQGIASPEARALYAEIIKGAREQSADTLILGCTELSYLSDETVDGMTVIDSSRVLAERLVTFAYTP